MGSVEDGHFESVRDEAFDGNGLAMIEQLICTLKTRHYAFNLVNEIRANLKTIFGDFVNFILNGKRPTLDKLDAFQGKPLEYLRGKQVVPENMQELMDTVRSAISDTANSS